MCKNRTKRAIYLRRFCRALCFSRRELILDTAVIRSNKMSIKSTLKLLLILLPIFGLLAGIGLGLILGNTAFETTYDLYLKIGVVLLPTISIVILALNRYFKQIDSF